MIKYYATILSVCFLTIPSFSQELDSVMVYGQVITKNHCTLPGVSIQIVDSKISSVTDVDGKFELLAPLEGVLSFSLISDPYYISLCDFVASEPEVYCSFRFEEKENYECEKAKPREKFIKLNKNNASHLFSLVACYNQNIESITLKYLKKYKSQDKEISFLINGELKPNVEILELDFINFRNAFIIKTTANKYVFVLDQQDKTKQ